MKTQKDYEEDAIIVGWCVFGCAILIMLGAVFN